MQELLKWHEPANIYNADNTALCFQALPDSTDMTKSTCKDVCGIKIAKDWLTVLYTAASVMTSITYLLLIYLKTHVASKTCKHFQLIILAQKTLGYLPRYGLTRCRHEINDFNFKSKKIAQVLGSCTAHSNVEMLKCIEIMKLPPHTTSLIQPCDMGVIQALKVYFRYEMLVKIIDTIED